MEQLIAILVLDTPDHNGIVFPTAVIEEAVQEFNTRREKAGGALMGELGLVGPGEEDRFLQIDMHRVSHYVKHLWIDNGVLKAKIALVGKFAQLAEELEIDFLGAPRAFGDIDEKQKVCTSYTIVTVDIEMPG